MNFTEQHHPLIFTNNTAWSFYIHIFNNIVYIILSLPANCYILWLLLTGKRAASGSDLFAFNLSVGEIFYCCGCVVLYAIPSFSLYTEFLSFIGVMPIFGRPLFLCLICVERYVAVVYPVTFLKCKPLRYRLACSAVVWVIVCGFGLFCMFILSSHNLYVFICVSFPIYSFFLTIKLFCCLAVLRALKVPGPGDRGRQREEANLAKRKAITHILILTVAMIFNYALVISVGISLSISHETNFVAILTIGVSISKIFAFVQPFLYIKQFGNLTLVFGTFWKL